ncbi:MAG: tetratricopeptide repeat protein [Atopobiaceae bacterium]
MNQEMYKAGVSAYRSGNWAVAASELSQAKQPGEVSGSVDHLLGNALMKLGRYDEAAKAYADALADSTYGKVGALNTNRGRALLAAGRSSEAVDALTRATQDPSYAKPYKAYLALGSAYEELGDVRSAGIAFRNAAIDENNPDPCFALRKLGGSFMELSRPVDAIEAYRTALDFSSSVHSQNAIYCELALAYVAANRMSEAVDAFNHATADGTYTLAPEAQASYDAARNAMAAMGVNKPSDTDNLLAAAGYGPVTYDPLDPTGETTGNLMPSPEDTGFFSINEEDIVKDAKEQKRKERKQKHTGRKVVITLVIILVVVCAAGGYAYYRGYGWPTQESVVNQAFEAKTNNGDLSSLIADSASSSDKSEIEALIPSGAQVSIDSVDRGMSGSTAKVSAKLSDGTTQHYVFHFTRDKIGWKISSVTVDTSSSNGSSSSTTTSGTVSAQN